MALRRIKNVTMAEHHEAISRIKKTEGLSLNLDIQHLFESHVEQIRLEKAGGKPFEELPLSI